MNFLNISLPYKLSSTENTKVNEHFCFRSYDLVKNAVKKIMGFQLSSDKKYLMCNTINAECRITNSEEKQA